MLAILNALDSPDRVASLEDEHGAGGVIVPVQALLPLTHPGPGGGPATLASHLTMSHVILSCASLSLKLRQKLPLRLLLIPPAAISRTAVVHQSREYTHWHL